MEVPDAMVTNYLERMIRPRKGVPDERIAEMRHASRPAAEQALKRMLVLDKVANLEGLQATPAELDARVEDLAARSNLSVQEVRARVQKSGQMAQLEEEITEDKVFAYLKSLSTIE